MLQPTGSCPQCGAKITFRWSSAIQTVCEFCQSILVRSDVDLRKVGVVADLPQDASPIQINTEGVWANKPFVVVGRILYEHEYGLWNEWHLLFNDGTSGWLSDAQLEYAISFRAPLAVNFARPSDAALGGKIQYQGVDYQITSRTLARYRGVDGQLPFEYWDKAEVWFVDCRTQDSRFATLDFSENPPLWFVGQFVDFEQLQLRNVREFEDWY